MTLCHTSSGVNPVATFCRALPVPAKLLIEESLLPLYECIR
jgi:hypothetical protein